MFGKMSDYLIPAASILAVLFLRGVGVVGGPHKPDPSEDEKSKSEQTMTAVEA